MGVGEMTHERNLFENRIRRPGETQDGVADHECNQSTCSYVQA